MTPSATVPTVARMRPPARLCPRNRRPWRYQAEPAWELSNPCPKDTAASTIMSGSSKCNGPPPHSLRGARVPSIIQGLASPRTSRWIPAARGERRYGALRDRLHCFEAPAAILAEQCSLRQPGGRWSQPEIRALGRPPFIAFSMQFGRR